MIQKIGIIGDVHSEHTRLCHSLGWFERQGVDAIICTGDIADGRGCLEQSWRALDCAQVHTVAGNHDRWLLENSRRHVQNAHSVSNLSDKGLAYISGLPSVVSLRTAGGELRLCHGVADDDMAKVWPGTERSPIRRSDKLDEWLAESTPPTFVVNGHMHFRTLIDFDSSYLVNAGTLKGQYCGISILDVGDCSVAGYNLSDDGSFHFTQKHSVFERSQRRVWRNTQAFDGAWQPTTLHTP